VNACDEDRLDTPGEEEAVCRRSGRTIAHAALGGFVIVAMIVGCVSDTAQVADDRNVLDVVGSRGGAGRGGAIVRPIPYGPFDVLPRGSWSGGAGGDTSGMAPMGTPYRLTIHHEGSPAPNEVYDEASVATLLKKTYSAHRHSQGWSDIAYHFAIDRAGRVWELRDLAWQGAHAGDAERNRGNIGIEVLGNFDLQELTPEQKRSLTLLVHQLCETHSIPPANIFTHRELKNTDCPGKNLQAFTESLRDSMK